MFEGIIPGSRASFMFDIVFVGMIVILPILIYSVYLVKFKHKYAIHKKIQLVLGAVLLVVVSLFELDVRLSGEAWKKDMQDSPYADTFLMPFLYFHIGFAVLTIILWFITIIKAIKKFDNPPLPNNYSPTHKKLGIASTIFMTITGLTGIAFYIMAFMMTKAG